MNYSTHFFATLCLLVYMLISWTPTNAQVQGIAYLSGETDHTGISVIFTSTSTSGQTDTTLTQFDGSYSINLFPGVYDIQMEAPGFATEYYNQNQSVLLNGNDVLDTVSLAPGPVQYVSNSFGDTLYSDTIYIATTDIQIAANESVYIQAGTTVKFEPGFTLTIEGKIEAIGDENNPILFTVQSINPGVDTWEGVYFNELDVVSKFDYCIFEYAVFAINVLAFNNSAGPNSNTRLFIENSIVRDCETGIGLDSDQPILVSNNEVFNYDYYAIGFFGTNYANGNGPYTISCNRIHDGDNYGIFTFLSKPNAYVGGNEIYDVNGIGIRVSRQGGGDVTVENNVIYRAGQGVAETSSSSPIPAIIRNNVVFSTGLGLSFTGEGGAIVQMNAVFNNDVGLNQFDPNYGTPSDVSYNSISQNTTNVSAQFNIPFVGDAITTNANGDSTDAYFNLVGDPLIDTLTFFPANNSPVIDAGDPMFTDLDGTTRDIGLFADNASCWISGAAARKVYPGDTNYDQDVSVWDVLPIGLKFGEMGTPRPNASLDWVPQSSPGWGDSLANGIDLKHMDTDGNGVINSDDTLAIQLNYQQTHNAERRSFANGVPLYLDMPTNHVPGDTMEIPIILGTMDSMANQLYGLAFSLNYDSSLIQPNSISIHFANSWVGDKNVDLLTIYHDEFNQSQFEVGMVRTDGMEVSGFGEIATMIVVLDDDIAKQAIPFQLTWGQVDLIHYDESPIAVSPQNSEGDIQTTSNQALLSPELLKVYPNPAQEWLTVLLEIQHADVDIQLLDMTGRQHLNSQMSASENKLQMSVADLAPGMYVLRLVEDGNRIGYQKVLIE